MSNIHAVVKATYTKNRAYAKASVRYFAHRIDREGNRTTRAIFGKYGLTTKDQAYRMIDQAKPERVYFYRIILSPERSTGEAANLPQITRRAMLQLQKILHSKKFIPFVAVAHTDHSNTPHVHTLAVLRTYLTEEKLTKLRETLERVVLTGQEQSAQTARTARHQLSASGVRTRSTGRSYAHSLARQPRFLPISKDIFIAKSVVPLGATRSGGV